LCTDEQGSAATGRGGRGRRGRGRGRGRGRSRGSTRRGPAASSLPWQTVSTSTDVAPTVPTFTATPGPHLQLPSNPQPVDFLEQLLDEDILGLVVDETNKYVTIHIYQYYCLLFDCWLHINNIHNVAQHIIGAIFHMHRYASEKISKLEAEGKLTRRSQFNKWSALTLPELHGFLAIIFNMGIIRLPELEDYWKTSWVAEVPFFSRVMPRDRFELLFWVLHASHSTGPLKRIDKVRLFVEKILSKFQSKYSPS